MRIRAIEPCDARVSGRIKALFAGQEYDVPDDAASTLIASGKAVRFGDVHDKAIMPEADNVQDKELPGALKMAAIRRGGRRR